MDRTFFINQKEVDGDEYFFRQDREPKIQDELLDEMIESDLDSCDECSLFDPEEELCTCDDDCGECELDAQFDNCVSVSASNCGCGCLDIEIEIDLEELKNMLVADIIEADGCPGCIRGVLDVFEHIVENIVVEDLFELED